MAAELRFVVETARPLHRRISVLQSFGVWFLFPLLSSGGGGGAIVSVVESRRFVLCLYDASELLCFPLGSSLFRVGEFFANRRFFFRWGHLGCSWWLHADGGGFPCGGPLYVSHRPAAHRSEWKVCLLAFWFEDKGAALGRVDGVDKARISHDSIHRRR